MNKAKPYTNKFKIQTAYVCNKFDDPRYVEVMDIEYQEKYSQRLLNYLAFQFFDYERAW
jgi:hypothetical protein